MNLYNKKSIKAWKRSIKDIDRICDVLDAVIDKLQDLGGQAAKQRRHLRTVQTDLRRLSYRYQKMIDTAKKKMQAQKKAESKPAVPVPTEPPPAPDPKPVGVKIGNGILVYPTTTRMQ